MKSILLVAIILFVFAITTTTISVALQVNNNNNLCNDVSSLLNIIRPPIKQSASSIQTATTTTATTTTTAATTTTTIAPENIIISQQQQQEKEDSSNNQGIVTMFFREVFNMRDSPLPMEEEANLAAAKRRKTRIIENVVVDPDSVVTSKNHIKLPLQPIMFNTIQTQNIAQTDILGKVTKYPYGDVSIHSGMSGHSYSTSYRLFGVVASLTRFLSAKNWSETNFWIPLGDDKFPTTHQHYDDKPAWKIDLSAIKTQLQTSPFNFNFVSEDIYSSLNNNQQNNNQQIYGETTGASFDLLKQKLSLGYLVFVVFQSTIHNHGICGGSWSPPARVIPVAVEVSRTQISVVVGICQQYIYLLDGCPVKSPSVFKVKRNDFMQRWHSCEKVAGNSNSCSILSGRAFWFSAGGEQQQADSSSSSSTTNSMFSRVLNNDPASVSNLVNAPIQ